MPETLKKLREPAALAAVVFAGLVILVGIINLLAPPGNGATSVPFSDRAYDEATVFLSIEVAAAVAFAVYLANHAGPAVAKARLITLAALIEVGLAALFGVITALAQFGASGVDGESKLLKFLESAGGAAVIAVAGLFTWITWQAFAPATRPAGQAAGAFIGGNWPNRQGGSGAGAGAGGASGQQFGQASPPPGGFGWTPQQSAQAGGQSSPTAFGQQVGQVPNQAAGYGQPQAQGAPGAPQPFGADRTQMLPPVQSGQPGQPGQPQQGATPGQPAYDQSAYGQPPQHGQFDQSGYSQPPQPPQLGQQIGQATLSPGTSLGGSSAHQAQPPLPPTMQGYAAEASPWSPGGPGAGGGQHGAAQQGSPQPGQQVPPTHPEDAEPPQRPGPFQIGDWRSE